MTKEGFRQLKRLEHHAMSMRAFAEQVSDAALALSEARRQHHEAISALDEQDRRLFANAILTACMELNAALRLMPATTSLLHDTWQLISPELAEEYEAYAAADRPAQH